MKNVLLKQSSHLFQCQQQHYISKRSFAHKDKLKKLKRQLGQVRRKYYGEQRGTKGRAPGWLEQSDFVGPRVAIIGRTNVGKSTLFNKLAGKSISIADNTAGVTRDRKEAQGRLVDLEFIMVDCPGIEELPSSILKERKIDLESREQVMRGMIEQSQYAIQYADIILFLYDAKVGIMEEDKYISHWLHHKLKLREIDVGNGKDTVMQSNLSRNMPTKQKDKRNKGKSEGNDGEIDKKYVIAIANKLETHMDADDILARGYELNLGQVIGMSNHSGDGFVDLFHSLDDIFQIMDVYRGETITQAYMDKYGKDIPVEDAEELDEIPEMDEELTYIPLSAAHEMQRDFDLKQKEDGERKNAEMDFMDSFHNDPFEMKYDENIKFDGFDELDKMNVDMMEENEYNDAAFNDLDYDQIKAEYDKMEEFKFKEEDNTIPEENGHLQDWEMEKYGKIAQTITNVDIDDAELLHDDDLIDVSGVEDENDAQQRLKQLFELKLCIVGRPNVGKSSLVNAILGENRCLVADVPGITRDSVAIPMYHKETGMNFKLIDTAGLMGLSRYSYEQQNEASRLNILVLRECIRSIRFSNIIGIVIDINDKVLNTIDYMQLPKKLVFVNNELRKLKLRNAKKNDTARNITEKDISDMNEPSDMDEFDYDELVDSNQMLSMDDESSKMDKLHFEAVNAARTIMNSIIDPFDRQLIEYCIAQGRGVVLVINKWDKITSKHKVLLKLLKHSLPLVFRETGGIPICVTSAKYNKGVSSFISNAVSIYNKWNSRVPTPILNRFIFEMQKVYPPPAIKQVRKHGRWLRYIRPKVRYMTQYTIRPPSFIAFCGTQIISEYYFYKLRRFLRNEFGLNGIPIRIKMRSNMDINKWENDAHLDRVLDLKKKKKYKLAKADKRKNRLRRLSLTEVLKLRNFRKQVKDYENQRDGKVSPDDKKEDYYTYGLDKEQKDTHNERYKKSMNAMIEQMQMSKEEKRRKKELNKKLTVDRFEQTERTQYRTYIPKQ